jgi:CheY-like chemotaxis protein
MKNARVLFVDDEPKIVLTMPHILRQQGYHVTAAASVTAALLHITSAHFDVLIRT